MRIPRTTLGALAVMLVASRALADEPAVAPAAPAAPPKTNPSGISEEARMHFAAGVALLQDPEGEKVEDAYREFQKAFEISPSPKILGNLGFCAMRLERDGEAIEAYSRYLREVPDIDADERTQIVRDLQTLTVGVARLTIQTDKPGVRLVDVRTPTRGERITNVYGPVDGKIDIGVRPGHHVITAKLADHEDAVWELDAFAASRDKYAFTMRLRVIVAPGPAAPQGSSTNVGPWVVMGIGGAMLVGGTLTGIVALDKTSNLESKCPNDVCPRSFDLDGERSSAKTFVRVTDVLLIGGSVVTLGGLGWLLFGGGKRESEPAKPAARASLPLPSAGCGADGCRASVKVVF
ncbi:MAG TPA: tetratricopeptide repeat protein [Labilithrix sp.]|nr:tetratricopeptide repeat protein [Labilithrix sp.]